MTSATRARAKSRSTAKYWCEIHHKSFSTEGGWRWHLEHYHPGVSVESYTVRAQEARNRDRYFIEHGFQRCPHIHIWCPGPNNAGPARCRGKEDCIRIQYQPWLAGLFEEGTHAKHTSL